MTSIADRIAEPALVGEADTAARAAPLPIGLAPTISAPPVSERELRLDLFRGLALWLIFIDHLPPNLLTWFTIRNYGFSDATEIFIFISGYTAAFVYGRAMLESGFMVATARILRRVWQIYTAHLLLFLVLMAEIAYVTTVSAKPEFYIQEMEVGEFFKQPGLEMMQALLLRFRPAWRQILSLVVVSATAGLGAILITEGFLGALPHGNGTSWAALALTVLAVSAPTAGLIALIGPLGLGLGATVAGHHAPFRFAASRPSPPPSPQQPPSSRRPSLWPLPPRASKSRRRC